MPLHINTGEVFLVQSSLLHACSISIRSTFPEFQDNLVFHMSQAQKPLQRPNLRHHDKVVLNKNCGFFPSSFNII